MRVVTIRARHRTFRQPVPVRFLELRPLGFVATGAFVVDRRSPRRPQSLGAFVHGVAGRAGHLVLQMAALDPPGVRLLVQVALQADLVRPGRRQLRRIPDVVGGGGLFVLFAATVAGLARPSFPAARGLRLDKMMRIPLEGLGKVVVTRLARIRAHVAGGLVLGRCERNGEHCRRHDR